MVSFYAAISQEKFIERLKIVILDGEGKPTLQMLCTTNFFIIYKDVDEIILQLNYFIVSYFFVRE